MVQEFGVTINELCSSEKRRELVRARAVLARAVQMKKGLGLRAVCKFLKKHHGTVSRLAVTARKDQRLESLATSLIDISE